MPSVPEVTIDLAVKIGSRRVQLIRGAARAIIVEEADRAAVLDTVRAAERA